LNFSDLFVTAEGFLHPADHGGLFELVVWNQVVGTLETDAAISPAGIGAIVSVHGVVGGKNKPISSFPLKVGNRPSELSYRCGCRHWTSGDADSLSVGSTRE
jgi:hypothetical protein